MDWKLLIVGAGILMLIAGLLVDSDFGGDVFDRIDSKSSGWLDSLNERLALAVVNGTVEYESFQVETELLKEIRLKTGEHGTVRIGDTVIKNSDSIIIMNYTGKVTFGDNITLDGKAAEIKAGDVVFESPSIDAEGIPINVTDIPEITEGDFLINVKEGEISISNSVGVSLEDEELEIVGFEGSLSLSDDKEAEFNGTFDRAYVRGKHSLRFTS